MGDTPNDQERVYLPENRRARLAGPRALINSETRSFGGRGAT